MSDQNWNCTKAVNWWPLSCQLPTGNISVKNKKLTRKTSQILIKVPKWHLKNCQMLKSVQCVKPSKILAKQQGLLIKVTRPVQKLPVLFWFRNFGFKLNLKWVNVISWAEQDHFYECGCLLEPPPLACEVLKVLIWGNEIKRYYR